MKVSHESLLQIPLIDQVFRDKGFQVQSRAISKEWYYHGSVPMSLTGFNPHLFTGFIAGQSRIHEWLKWTESSARTFNKNDHLWNEVLMLTHDYLHSWAYRAIHELAPQSCFGSGSITEKNFEDFVFCHLLSEAVAVVGLDYWYLATVDIRQICPIGMSRSTLTVPYHEKYLSECHYFNPDFQVQTPQFLEFILDFYCSGEFIGFDADTIAKSTVMYNWLCHEVSYGDLQRQFTRLWMHRFSEEDFSLEHKQLQAPIKKTQKWQKDLVRDLSQLLWDKVKNQKMHDFKVSPQMHKHWKNKKHASRDFRFLNLNNFDPTESLELMLQVPGIEENFKYFFYQFISRYDFHKFDQEKMKLFPHLLQSRDLPLIKSLFKNEKILPMKKEPTDLFMLS